MYAALELHMLTLQKVAQCSVSVPPSATKLAHVSICTPSAASWANYRIATLGQFQGCKQLSSPAWPVPCPEL